MKCYKYTALQETMDGKFLLSAEQELKELFFFYRKEIIKGEFEKKWFLSFLKENLMY